MGSSPHVIPQRAIGYDFVAWQEASLNPYTIRFREGKDREETMVHQPPGRPDYPHPVSVTVDRLLVRLPAEFAGPWQTGVVVPTESQAKLPFPVPLPKDAVFRGATEHRGQELVDGEWRRGSVRLIWIVFLSRMEPPEIRRFYKQALEGWATVTREETSTTWQFDRVPPWAPALSKSINVEPQGQLFATPLGHAVSEARYASGFQAKTLPHLPGDVRSYLITVFLKKEPYVK